MLAVINDNVMSLFKTINPRRYRPFTINDYPNLLGQGIILCKGTFFLKMVGCTYTHCALYSYGTVYESTDPMGVISLPIEDFLANYLTNFNGIAYYRFADYVDIQSIFNKLKGKPYETDALEFIESKYQANTTEDGKSYFCSEFVAEVLQEAGLLPNIRLSNNYTPDDFVNIELVNNSLIRTI